MGKVAKEGGEAATGAPVFLRVSERRSVAAGGGVRLVGQGLAALVELDKSPILSLTMILLAYFLFT
jgi:hypothetical protein